MSGRHPVIIVENPCYTTKEAYNVSPKIMQSIKLNQLLQHCYVECYCLEELDADGFAQGNVLVGVGEEACVGVASEDLNLVAVAAAA